MRYSLLTRLSAMLVIFSCLSYSGNPALNSEKSISQNAPAFRVLVLYENGGHHIQYSTRAKPWLEKLAADSNFSIDYIQNTEKIDEKFLDQYQLFIQLDYAPYAWTRKAVAAFQQYIEKG